MAPLEASPTSAVATGPGRLAVVLSTGGVGGIAHLGALSRLVEAGIGIDALVGASAGALVAAYYAALGDPLPVLIEDAARTSLGRLLAFALHLRHLSVGGEETRQHCRRLNDRLAALDEVTFDRLRGPVPRLGVLAFDWRRGGAFFGCTGGETTGTHSVGRVVRGSASIPIVFPPVLVRQGSTTHLLSDGGLVRSLPLEWALAAPLSATHALGVQLPTLRRRLDALLPARRRFLEENRGRLLVVTPRIALLRNAFRGRQGLEAVYEAGRAAIDDGVLARLRRWQEHPPARGA
jgi:predicted acylesterase/phospholipase RssA